MVVFGGVWCTIYKPMSRDKRRKQRSIVRKLFLMIEHIFCSSFFFPFGISNSIAKCSCEMYMQCTLYTLAGWSKFLLKSLFICLLQHLPHSLLTHTHPLNSEPTKKFSKVFSSFEKLTRRTLLIDKLLL